MIKPERVGPNQDYGSVNPNAGKRSSVPTCAPRAEPPSSKEKKHLCSPHILADQNEKVQRHRRRHKWM